MAAAGVTETFTLPPHLEAAEPPEARGLTRDEVRLLVSRADAGTIQHARFKDLPQWLSAGDLLVVNTSGTLNAAIAATHGRNRYELHLSTRLPGDFWVVEVRCPGPIASVPYDRRRPPATLDLPGGGRAALLAPYPFAGSIDVRSRLWIAALQLGEPVLAYLERFGSAIRYSYVTRPWPSSMYQTVFAEEAGSAEMPSAGRPFTFELVTRLLSQGVQIAPLLLHTGVARLEDHEPPYEEYFRVPALTAERVNATRRAGHRIIAVGTTAVRALETVTDRRGSTSPGEGWTNVVIARDRPLRAITGLITGLHEPRATHLAIVSQAMAAAGAADPLREVNRAYDEARNAGYLWHEFGDSHLILGSAASGVESPAPFRSTHS